MWSEALLCLMQLFDPRSPSETEGAAELPDGGTVWMRRRAPGSAGGLAPVGSDRRDQPEHRVPRELRLDSPIGGVRRGIEVRARDPNLGHVLPERRDGLRRCGLGDPVPFGAPPRARITSPAARAFFTQLAGPYPATSHRAPPTSITSTGVEWSLWGPPVR